MAIQSILNMPAPVQEHFHKRMLDTHVSNLIYGLGVMEQTMPANSGQYIVFSRMHRLGTAMVPLSDTGEPIAGVIAQRTDIHAQIQLFGLYTAFNQKITLQNQDDYLMNLSNLMGISLRETEDALIRDCILSSATFIRATGGMNGDIPTDIAESDVDDITTMLMGNDAATMLAEEFTENRYGSAPINDAYLALCHTDMFPSLNSMENFTRRTAYSNPNAAFQRSEVGTVGYARFFASSKGAKLLNASAFGNTVYPVTFMGVKAVATIQQDNFSSQLIYRDAMYSDALAQNATLGWTASMANVITDDEWVANLYCTL